MNSEGGNHQNAGAVAFGGHNNAAPAQFTVGAVGFGPMPDEDDGWVQLTHAGWRRVADGMATSIVRISGELEECQAQIAVYEAERAILLRERDDAREALREIAAADWRTSGELRGMARRALEAIK